MNYVHSAGFPLKCNRSIGGKYACFKMFCTVKDVLGVTETVSFPAITVNWWSPNFCWIKFIWLF